MEDDGSSSLRRGLVRAGLLPALATVLVWFPQVFLNSQDQNFTPLVPVLLFLCAPGVALLVNWRWPAATNADRAMYAALPQVAALPAIVWFDLWIEVQQGWLIRNTSEEAMSFGIGLTLAAVVGVMLVMLVAATGRLGAWLGAR